MKLEIGCGLKKHKGYQTIDVEEYAHPDYLGDFRTMSFKEVDEIRSHHLFEHFSRKESEDILNLWRGWLKNGGRLIIETPDFEGICKTFTNDTLQKHRYWLARHAFGSQGQEWAFHRDGWWEAKFREVLARHGFKVIGVEKSISRDYLPNITVVAIKE